MATRSSVLAWKIPRTEELGGPSPWGHKESDTMECMCMRARARAHTHTHTHTHTHPYTPYYHELVTIVMIKWFIKKKKGLSAFSIMSASARRREKSWSMSHGGHLAISPESQWFKLQLIGLKWVMWPSMLRICDNYIFKNYCCCSWVRLTFIWK